MRANSLVKSIEKAAESDRRSIPGDAPGHRKWTQNRCLDPLGRPRGVQERPEDVSGASRERPGASPAPSGSARRVAKGAPERQKRAPWSAWERAAATKIDAKSRPGTKKSSCLGTVRSQTDFHSIFTRFRSIFGCSRKSFGERSHGEIRSIFGSSLQSPTLTKHCP